MAEQLPEPVRERMRASFWYAQAAIPKGMWSRDWSRFGAESGHAAAAQEVVAGWIDEGSYEGLALFGNPGTGKTTLLATMLCEYLFANIPRTLNTLFSTEVSAYFITLADYHRLYLRSYELDRWAQRDPGDEQLKSEWLENFRLRTWIEEEVAHLALDDVGKEHQTSSGAVEDEFHALIRGRFARGLSTSITSNLSAEEFAMNYGEAQLSFIHEACRIREVVGPDFRRKKG